MNLPDYLAPAPRFTESHDLDWSSISEDPMRARRVIRCVCGAELSLTLYEQVRSANEGQAFWDKWEPHYLERLAAFRLAAKWGPNSPPISLDNHATPG